MFTVSPGVNVSEIDLSTGIASVSSTQAALAGVFRWGPVGQRFKVTSESDLVSQAGKPTNFNAETWFTAASFLAYSNDLTLVRVGTATSAMAVFSSSTPPSANTQTVNNPDAYANVTFSANVAYVARFPGDLGNTLRVSQCDSANAFYRNLNLVANSDVSTSSNLAINVGSSTATLSFGFTGSGTQATANAAAFSIYNSLQTGDQIKIGNSSIGTQYLKVQSVGIVTSNSTIATFQINFATPFRLSANWSASTVDRYWEFYNRVSGAPGTSAYVSSFGNTAAADEVHLVVIDDGGKFTGVPGSILETYVGLSRATDAKTPDGSVNYYKDVLNNQSSYIWWANDRTGAASANAATVSSASTVTSQNITFQGGSDGADETSVSLSAVAQGYDLFKAPNEIDISLVLTGKARNSDGATLANYIIDNVAEGRKDCVAFVSPPKETVVNNAGQRTDSVTAFGAQIRPSSYRFMDTGYKYMYDTYNDVYRWIPLNGDIAGLAARCDKTNDPWWSFAGIARGQIKNVVKLAWNPTPAARDQLYAANINPVISERGNGTYLFGDKTGLAKNSAFSRINVRRLFIVIEKAIANDAKNQLFEFNDPFTQAQFKSRVVPYLRNIKGRRGITDFAVICDSTNNTPDVVDNEQFVGDIYIKPARAINTIQLNFIAVRSGVQFNEVIGQF